MKNYVFSYRVLPVIALAICVLQSCQKSNAPTSQPAATSQGAQLMAATNLIYSASVTDNETLNDVMAAGESADSLSHCAVITFTPSKTVYPHQKVIDFGTGCTGEDGHTRKGKKIVTVLVDPKTATAGAEISEVTFENYYLDTINITGVVKEFLVAGSNPGPKVLRFESEKSIFSPNGDKNIISGTHEFTQTAGANTLTRSDDVYEITGHAEGTETLDGATIFTWTSDVDDAHHVIKPVACGYRTQGGLKITIHLLTGGDATFTEYLDYGDGSCDNLATLSINGGTPQQVTLPILFWPLSL